MWVVLLNQTWSHLSYITVPERYFLSIFSLQRGRARSQQWTGGFGKKSRSFPIGNLVFKYLLYRPLKPSKPSWLSWWKNRGTRERPLWQGSPWIAQDATTRTRNVHCTMFLGRLSRLLGAGQEEGGVSRRPNRKRTPLLPAALAITEGVGLASGCWTCSTEYTRTTTR